MQADDPRPVEQATAALKASLTGHQPMCRCEHVCRPFQARHDGFVAAALTGILASNSVTGGIDAHVRMAIRYANETLERLRGIGAM